MTGSARIIRGNALDLPLADASVDLVVTSPPYFGLRSYQDAGEHYAGQIGSEATPGEFVDALIAATREMVRVLKPSGSIWVNLGDKYATTCPPGSGGKGEASKIQQTHPGSYTAEKPSYVRPDNGGVPIKSLMGIPWRYALRCIDDLGLILRAEIIWSKPNGLPESVTDRVRRSHEQWFHFVRQPRYFSAVDEIREEHARLWDPAKANGSTGHGRGTGAMLARPDNPNGGMAKTAPNPLGKLPGSVWQIPTQPLTVPPELGVDHFAAFPMEWPRRIIQGWSPSGVCSACGEGRRPVVAVEGESTYALLGKGHARNTDSEKYRADWNTRTASGTTPSFANRPRSVTGYACACPEPTAPTRPSGVLDCFGGTGTTALVAKALGRTGISVDMSADYCRLANWRCNDPGQMAAALQVEKPEPVHPDQLDLFDGEFETPVKVRGNSGSSLVGVVRFVCDDCGKEANNSRASQCEVCGGNLGRPAKRFQKGAL
jgi:DNA modification methylase